MGTKLNIAVIQIDLEWEQPLRNRKNIEMYLQTLQQGTDVVFLPEMFSTAFTMRPQNVAEPMNGDTIQWMLHWAKNTQFAIAGSCVIEEEGRFYNRFLWVNPDGQIHFYDKRHPFTLAGEHKVYETGQNSGIIQFKGWKICLRICYDLRFPVWSRNTEDYDVLVYVANWPSPRINAWDTLLQARAIENMSFTIGVNRVGIDTKENVYPGHSAVYDCLGAPLGFLKEKEGVIQVTLVKKDQDKIREKLNFLNDRDTFTL